MSAEPWYAGQRPSHRPVFDLHEFLAGLNAPEWMSSGLCAQTDPESFFPEKGGSVREAKAICASCDVRTDCLAYALDNEERFGIWGGYSERERRHLKRNPGAQPRPCERDGCEGTIPFGSSAGRRFHSAECGNLARQDRLIAELDPQPILTAYADGRSVSTIAIRHKLPIPVVSRVLDEHGVRRIRGRRPVQEATA